MICIIVATVVIMTIFINIIISGGSDKYHFLRQVETHTHCA